MQGASSAQRPRGGGGLGIAQVVSEKVSCSLAFRRTAWGTRWEAGGCREGWPGSGQRGCCGGRRLGDPWRGGWACGDACGPRLLALGGSEREGVGCELPGGGLGPLSSGARPAPLKRGWQKPSRTAPPRRCQGQMCAGQEGASVPQSVRRWVPDAWDSCRHRNPQVRAGGAEPESTPHLPREPHGVLTAPCF